MGLQTLRSEDLPHYIYDDYVQWEGRWEDTVVQPDVLVVCGKVKRLKGKRLEIPPALIFEILSPATTRKDRIIKYQLYQEAGVKYYCIVDPETRNAEVYELLYGEYGKKDNFKDGKIHFDLDPCGIDYDFSKIFQE